MGKKGRMILVRHGETHANVAKVWHGQTDTPLTDKGREQAARLGAHFRHIMQPDVIYASTLARARDTAQAIAEAHGLAVKTDPRLMEFHLGDWEDMSFADLHHKLDVMRKLRDDAHFAPPGGESQALVRKRMVEAMEEIMADNRGKNIVVVSHGVALAVALSHYLHDDTTRWSDYSMQNTAVSELCPEEKKLLLFNRTDHLED